MKKKRVVLGFLLTLVATAVLWYAMRPSPQVVGLRTQNGWSIAAVERVGSSDVYLWRRCPLIIFGFLLPLTTEGPEIDTDVPSSKGPKDSLDIWLEQADFGSSPSSEPMSVEAQASTGDSFSLRLNAADRTHFEARIPPGWPPSCRWIEIVLHDQAGNDARWRLVHLPPARRAFMPPTAPSNIWHGPGGALTLQAWSGKSGTPDKSGVRARLVAALAPNGYFEILQRQPPLLEWGETTPARETAESACSLYPTLPTCEISLWNSPWSQGVGWVRYACRVRRVDVLRETVTLHNLRLRPVLTEPDVHASVWDAPPQRVKTASGVILETAKIFSNEHAFGIPNEPLSVRVMPNSSSVYLPASPLCRRFGKPVQIVLSIPGGIEQVTTGRGECLLYPLRRHGETFLPSVTVTVEQRAVTAESDAVFTAPVSHSPPPGAHP